MSTDEIENARLIARRVEEFVDRVSVLQFGQAWEADPDRSEERVTTFVEVYIESGRYPLDQLEECTRRAVEVRLQPEYVFFDMGEINKYWYAGPQGEPATDDPYAVLARAAMIQSTIMRVRILWEKIFRLVYYLEENRDLAPKSKKGVKRQFFEWCALNSRFRFLEVYAEAVSELDEKWRTGEVHKHSNVRSLIIGGGREIDENEIFVPLNRASSVFRNVVAVVRDGRPMSFDELHYKVQGDPTSGISERYVAEDASESGEG